MSTRRTLACWLLASALVAATAKPAALTPADIPNPLRDPASCGRHAPSWICDTAGALSPGGGDELEGVLRDIAGARKPYAAAACAPSSGRSTLGHQVAVVIVPRMKLRSGEEPGEGAARFAGALMGAWGVGQAGCDDGVVVFVSVGDRQAYVLAGRGAAAALPPKSAALVTAAMAPRLRAGDADAALKGAAVDVGLCLAGAPPPGAPGGFDWGLILFLAIFVFVVLSAGRAALARRRQLAGARAALDRLRTEQAAAQELGPTSAYPATSCPVCLEDFGPVEGGCTDDGGECGGTEGTALLPATPTPTTTLRPLALACGHTFCEPCIRRWLARSDTCPICRAGVGAGAAPVAAAGAAATTPTASRPPPRPYDPSLYRDELVFRLGSLSRLYPAVVTAEVLRGLVTSARSGAPLPRWTDVRGAEMTDARTATRRRYEGGHGARAEFGGGSAVGASGGGASW